MLKKYFFDNFLFLSLISVLFSAFFQLAIANTIAREILFINFGLVWIYYIFLNHKLLPGIRNKNSLLILPILLVSFFYDVLEKESVFLYFSLGVLALNYPKNTFWAGIRTLKFAKAFFIAFVWASLVVLPIGAEKLLYDWQAIALVWLVVYCIVLVVAILFDIKDQKTDFGSIQTLPTYFGVTKTRWIAIAILLLAFAFLLFGFLQLFFSSQFFYTISFTLIYLMVMVFLSNSERPVLFYSFWVESTLAIPILVYWLELF